MQCAPFQRHIPMFDLTYNLCPEEEFMSVRGRISAWVFSINARINSTALVLAVAATIMVVVPAAQA